MVDVKTTSVGATFDASKLYEVPSATDVWAVLQNTPGIRMRGYDVGGSHKSQQSGYETFGVRSQARVVSDGVNSTEGTGGTGFYFDYYNVEEFKVSGMGADVEMSTPGASVVMTVKSGGSSPSGLYHLDYTGESMVTDNVDDALKARRATSAPVILFYEGHADFGGPILKDRFWAYGAYNHFKIDDVISGRDPAIATDIGVFDAYTVKGTIQLTKKDQLIGYSQWGLKQKPFRGLSLTTPAESILAQNSWSWVHKGEWQRVWNDRLFTNVLIGHFGFGWPMVPAVDPKTNPPRQDSATGLNSGAGWQPFTFYRWKPQSTGQINYYVPEAAGSHDFKFGWDWQVDSSQYGLNNNSGSIRYLDNSALGRPRNVNQILFSSNPNFSDDRNQHTDFFAQDIWALNKRVTLTLGVRIGRQDIYYKDAPLTPAFQDPLPGGGFPTGTIASKDIIAWWNVAPRLGITYDVTGSGKTVFKGYYGRYYANFGTGLSGANPSANATRTYQFLDQNQNGLHDNVSELGNLLASSGGAVTNVSPDLDLEYADEISFSVEHELVADTGLRVSYVRKMYNNWWTRFNRGITNNLTVPVTTTCSGCPGSFAGTTLNLVTVPAPLVIDNIYDQTPGANNLDFDTIQVALNRRFTKGFFIQGNFDYQWRNEMRSALNDSQDPLTTDPIGAQFYINYNPSVPLVQENTSWNAKLLARYTLPREIGLATSVRHQSGYPWAPIYRAVGHPVVGTVPLFLENVQNNRSDNVTIVDFRVDKAFNIRGSHKVTAMLDIYNLLNSNPETNFIMRTGASFNSVIEWLSGRTAKIGIRYSF